MNFRDTEMIILRFHKTFQLRVTEWALATILFNWGVLTIFNPGILDQSFAGLLRLTTEAQWGAMCLVLAVMRLMALAVNGAWRPTPHIRAVTSACGMLMWILLSFALANGGKASLGLAVYPVFAVLDIYNVYRASSDARVADERAKLRRLGNIAHA
jgi:hypothetical protein